MRQPGPFPQRRPRGGRRRTCPYGEFAERGAFSCEPLFGGTHIALYDRAEGELEIYEITGPGKMTTGSPSSREQSALSELLVGMTQRRSFGFGLLASAVGMLVALGLGCTPSEPTSNETTPKAKTLEPAKPDPQPLYPRSDEPWVWYHALPPGLSGGLMNVGVSNVAYQRFVGARFRDIVEVKDDHLEVRREELSNSD